MGRRGVDDNGPKDEVNVGGGEMNDESKDWFALSEVFIGGEVSDLSNCGVACLHGAGFVQSLCDNLLVVVVVGVDL